MSTLIYLLWTRVGCSEREKDVQTDLHD